MFLLDFIVSTVELFHHGGWVMYPLLACSVLVVAIGAERFMYYRRTCRANENTAQKVLNLAKEQKWQEIENFCAARRCFISDVLLNGLKYRSCPMAMKESFEEIISVRANGLKRNLNYLDTIVTMAPLLGLLGTVIGMIGSFKVLDVSGDNPALITGGVGEALIATATGLCVAVLALIVHSYFSNRLDSVLTDVENVCTFLISRARGKKQ
ncbi:MotA/TolQ/ExbB proton channel family protein [Megamonas sp.]